MKFAASICVLLLLVAQASAARTLKHGTPPPVVTPPAVTATAGATVTAGTSGHVAAGSAGTTANGGATVSAAEAKGTGNNVVTNINLSGKTPTSQGTLTTGGTASGPGGAQVTSIGQVLTNKNSASSTGFTNLQAAGPGAFITGAIQGSAKSPTGTSTFSSNTAGTGNSVAGEVSGIARSNLADLLAKAISIVNNENLSASSTSTATILNPKAGDTTDATAGTIVDGTAAQALGTADFKGAGTGSTTTKITGSG